jgi:uncharacterized protein (TIGR00369 family)
MDIFDDSRCFVCGKNNDCGIKLNIVSDNDNKTATATTVIDEKFCGWAGIVHGGIISTLLDEIMAYAAFTAGGTGVTGEMTVRFKKPVPAGREITIAGKIDSQKGRIVYASGKIILDGEVMAESQGKMVMLKKF